MLEYKERVLREIKDDDQRMSPEEYKEIHEPLIARFDAVSGELRELALLCLASRSSKWASDLLDASWKAAQMRNAIIHNLHVHAAQGQLVELLSPSSPPGKLQ